MANSKIRYKKSLSKKNKAKDVVRKKIKQSKKERDKKLMQKKIDSDSEDINTSDKSDDEFNIPENEDFGAEMDENAVSEYFGNDFLDDLNQRVKRQESGEEVLEPREQRKGYTEAESREKFGEPVFSETSSEDEEDDEEEEDDDDDDDEHGAMERTAMDGTEIQEDEDEDEEDKQDNDEDPVEGLKRFREELKELAADDPNFEEYMSKDEYEKTLQNIDQELEQSEKPPEKQIMNAQIFQDWLDNANENQTLENLRKCIIAFRLVCNPFSTKEKTPIEVKEEHRDQMFVIGLQEFVDLFNSFLNRDPQSDVPPNENKKWRKISSYVMSFCTNAVRYISEHENVSGDMLLALNEAIPFFGIKPAKARRLLRVVLDLVAADKEEVRVRAFYLVHQMAIKYPYPFISSCMKGIYAVYAKHCYPLQPQSYAKIIFLVNCVTQLYSINADCAYQHAYVYLRFVAVTLRNGLAAVPRKMKAKTKQAKRKQHAHPLSSWKYVNLLRVWTDVICHMPKENELGELIYPLVQTIIGTFQLCSEVKHLPIRLLLVSFLNKISRHCSVYIPVVPYLLDILSSQAISSKPTTTCKSPPDLMFQLHFDSKMMSTLEYKTAVSKEVMFLLLEHLAAHSNFVAFPEMVDATLKALRKFKSRDDFGARQYRKRVTQIIHLIEENNKVIFEKRATSGLAPKNVDKDATMLPIEQTPLYKRYKTEQHNREERIKMLFASFKRSDVIGEPDDDDIRVPLVSEEAAKKRAERKRKRQQQRRRNKKSKINQMSQIHKTAGKKKKNKQTSAFQQEKKKVGTKRRASFNSNGPSKKRNRIH